MANRAKYHNCKNKYKMMKLNKAAAEASTARRKVCEAAKREAKEA